MSLNSGFGSIRDVKVTEEDNELIKQFMLTKGITECQPSSLSGNEQSRATQQLIAQKRREFRKAHK